MNSMRFHIYSPTKKRIRLKRSRRMSIFFLPLFLLIPTIILGLLTLSKEKPVQPIKAQVVNCQEASALGSLPGADEIPVAPTASTGAESAVPIEQPAETAEPENAPAKPCVQTVSGCIQPGQTISVLLDEHLSPGEIHSLSRQCRDVYSLRRIKAGHDYRLYLNEKQLKRFEYDIDKDKKLSVSFDSGSIKARTQDIDYSIEQKLIKGTIESSLFKAVNAAGETNELAIALAEIFAWDIDFIRDIRSGDSFRLLVEKRYRFGDFAGYGNILAAQFNNRGQAYQAFLFDDGKGRAEYYNAEGQAVRKTFLKAPLNFTRISSGYTWKRKHPILDVVRPHLGIDYAAPRGTPIKSVADGEVLARAYDRQAGHYVKIRHHNGYVTIYNHMKRFARGLSRGQDVAQGEVIGYVGTTGLSTGPHLDYRVKRYGKYVNPLKIKSEPVKPVPEAKRAEFRQRVQNLIAVLDGQGSLYAYAEDEASTPSVQ
jgi:murein DD-endopeptidase MepM/ murein hydrolase activator NlpD